MEPASPHPLPPEIRVERPAPDILRYVLPRRPLGNYRWLAVLPLAFAAFGIIFTWGWIAPLAQVQWPVGSLIWLAFEIFFVCGTVVAPVAIAAAILWGHSSIEIHGGNLWAVEHVSIFRWGHRRRLAQIRQLLVGAPNEKYTPHESSEAVPATFAAIHIETAGGKSRLAAMGYPRDWLLLLAHELARQVHARQPDLSNPTTPAQLQVDVVDLVVGGEDIGAVERFKRPHDSLIVMTQQPGSLTFEVPPSGIKRGAGFLFAFACFWLGFMTLCTGVIVFGQPQQPQPGQALPNWTIIPFFALFWLIGIGLMLAALSAARSRAAIAVADGRCLIIEKGLFSESKRVWETNELRSVQVGPSGMEVNDKPVMELQFIPTAGDKVGILTSHNVAELQWLATHLRKALELAPITSGAVMLADVETKPATSNAACQQQPGTLTIDIPRTPLGRGPLSLWVSAIVSCIILTVVVAVFLVANRQFEASVPILPLVILGILACGIVAMFGVALHMTIRRAAIAFADGRLLVLQFGLFGTRRHEWSVEELAAIRAATSGDKVNFRRLMHLQIVPASGKTVSLLLGRDDEELAWLATQLRRATSLPAESQAERESRLPKVPVA